MLYKYIGETIYLVPSDILFNDKDTYSYRWIYNFEVFSTSYKASIVLQKYGLHVFKLISTHKISRVESEIIYEVYVTLPVARYSIPTPVGQYVGITSIWFQSGGEGGGDFEEAFNATRDLGIDYATGVILLQRKYYFSEWSLSVLEFSTSLLDGGSITLALSYFDDNGDPVLSDNTVAIDQNSPLWPEFVNPKTNALVLNPMPQPGGESWSYSGYTADIVMTTNSGYSSVRLAYFPVSTFLNTDLILASKPSADYLLASTLYDGPNVGDGYINLHVNPLTETYHSVFFLSSDLFDYGEFNMQVSLDAEGALLCEILRMTNNDAPLTLNVYLNSNFTVTIQKKPFSNINWTPDPSANLMIAIECILVPSWHWWQDIVFRCNSSAQNFYASSGYLALIDPTFFTMAYKVQRNHTTDKYTYNTCIYDGTTLGSDFYNDDTRFPQINPTQELYDTSYDLLVFARTVTDMNNGDEMFYVCLNEDEADEYPGMLPNNFPNLNTSIYYCMIYGSRNAGWLLDKPLPTDSISITLYVLYADTGWECVYDSEDPALIGVTNIVDSSDVEIPKPAWSNIAIRVRVINNSLPAYSHLLNLYLSEYMTNSQPNALHYFFPSEPLA